jgi:hypothetical protein
MANERLIDLPLITPTTDDLLYVVDNPGGTPADAATTIASLLSLATFVGTITPQGRLTLSTGTPSMAASVTGATSIFYTPAVGNLVPIYNGTSWTFVAFSELSQATTDATKSPAACTTNSNYDLFVWNDSGTIRCTRGPAWSSDTSRGTGAGTTELEFVNGLLMNKNAITNGPGADRGTYVGTVRTNGTSTIDMIFGGVGAAGGESTILGIWNMYNRRFVTLVNFDNTDSWNYTTASYRVKNGNNNNKISFVVGWQGDGLSAINAGCAYNNTTTSVGARVGIGVNSTTNMAVGSSTGFARNSGASARLGFPPAHYVAPAPLGFNYVAPLEYSAATGTGTFYGDDGGATGGGSDAATFILTTMY